VSVFHLSIFGRNSFDAVGLEPGEPLVAVSIFGALDLDLSEADVPLEADVTVLSVFGATRIRLRCDQPVRLRGFSVFGERWVEPVLRIEDRRGEGARAAEATSPPVDLAAFSVFGSLEVVRDASRSLC
jgi:hypothetical protein